MKEPKIVEIKKFGKPHHSGLRKSNFDKFWLGLRSTEFLERLERLYWTDFLNILLPQANADYVHFLQFYL